MGQPNKKGGRVTPKKVVLAVELRCPKRSQAYARPMEHLYKPFRTTLAEARQVKHEEVCQWCGKRVLVRIDNLEPEEVGSQGD